MSLLIAAAATAHRAAEVAVRSVAEVLLTAAAAATAVAGTESVRSAAGLADSELGNRPRGRLLSFGPWQRRADQAAMRRARIQVALGLVGSVPILVERLLVLSG
jgi:hypothetical protein